MGKTVLQIRGGTTAQHEAFIGAVRELTADVEKKVLIFHDGVTPGGHPLAREQVVLDAVALIEGIELITTANEAACATSETNAAASEAAALVSKNNAAASESAAQTSETNALASKNAAATSETNAANSESAAQTSKTNAADSETNALASKNAAETAETDAQTARTAAELAETHAETAQTAAELAKTNAETAETNAAASETAVAGVEAQVTAEGVAQVTNVTNEGDTQDARVVAEGNTQIGLVNTAGSTQVSAVSSEGGTQVTNVTNEGTSRVSAVTAEGNTQDARVLAEGNTQDTRVENEGNTQIARVIAEGNTQDTRLEDEGDNQIALILASGGTPWSANGTVRYYNGGKVGIGTNNPAEFLEVIGNIKATLFKGTATEAQYADIAEMYLADLVYEPGTILVFGGKEEVTISNELCDPRVAGIVSAKPAYLMNSDLIGTAVALLGRVPCKVAGYIRKGDLIVASQLPGYGIAKVYPRAGSVVGKAMENKLSDGKGVIEVVVGRL